MTTKELAELLKEKKYAFTPEKEEELKNVKCDAPYNTFSGSAYIYGKTAGVSESVVRYVKSIHNEPFKPEEISKEVIWTHTDKI